MKIKLILLFFTCVTFANAQISVFASVGNAYEDLGIEQKRSTENHWGLGLNGQVYVGDGLSHLEINAEYRFKNYQGFYTNFGLYLNALNGGNKKANVRVLFGGGGTYDTYLNEPDFYADGRLSIRFDNIRLDLGSKMNLLEAAFWSPVPEVYAKVSVSLSSKYKKKP